LSFDLTFQAKASRSSTYRADIDGLRAIAVLAVVCFHANVVHVTGGFVGVDIFFVISGHLITQVIDAEMEQGRFTFRGFYERRMRRIFPALFAVALFCALAGAALFPPLRFAEFGQSLLAMTGFVNNIYFQRTNPESGYFGDTSGAQLLLHTWTLALEEQFYLLFPVLLLLLNKFARPLRGVVVLVLLLLSFRSGAQAVQSNLLADHVTAFYLLPGRAWELLLGALLDRNYAEKSEVVNIGSCDNFRTELKRYEDANFCEVGHQAKNILVWGDSHAGQLYPLLNDLQREGQLQGHGLVYAVAAACPPAQTLNLHHRTGFHCNTFARYTMMRAAKDDIDTVFLVFAPWWILLAGETCLLENSVCGKILTGAEAWEQFLLETGGTIRALRKSGRRVIISLPLPIYDRLIPDYQIRCIDLNNHPRLQGLFGNPIELMPRQRSDELRAVADAAGAIVYDPRETLCRGDNCMFAIDNVSLYSDQGHLATSQLGVVRPGIIKALQSPSPALASSRSNTP